MKEIQLNNVLKCGNYKKYIALVDDEDYELVNQYSWHVAFAKKLMYAMCTTKEKKTLRMHQLIMNSHWGQIIDHKDGNGLNNQKSNLRFCTRSQNSANKKSWGGCKYLGVSETCGIQRRFRKDIQEWVVYKYPHKFISSIRVDGRYIHVGTFNTAEDAARARDKVAKEYFGEFARLNFPEE